MSEISVRQVYRFFAIVLVLSVPFYAWGIFWPVRGLPFGLPATAVMVIVPGAIATLLIWNQEGHSAVGSLWKRAVGVGEPFRPLWLGIAILCMPIATLASFAIMKRFALPLPAQLAFPIEQLPAMVALYGVGAILEEAGWTGYATPPLQRRFGIIGAGVLIGLIWALWHVVPWWLGQGHRPSWVVGQIGSTVAMRIVMGWIYARGDQSLLGAVLFHTMINVSYSLFPNSGSHYDPRVMCAVLAALVAGIILTRARPAPEPSRARAARRDRPRTQRPVQ